jgi:phosphopantothenoylcysteine synthetase/decarboxylase
METLLVKVSGRKKANMLLELLKSMDFIESVDLMEHLKTADNNSKAKLSDKYRGFLSKEDGQKLNEHIKQMRSEWNSI